MATYKDSKKKRGYHEQDGCHDCMHVFKLVDWEDPGTYFCTLGAKPRPLCGSSSMGESYSSAPEGFDAAFRAWDRWSKGRGVEPFGVCKFWCKKANTRRTSCR